MKNIIQAVFILFLFIVTAYSQIKSSFPVIEDKQNSGSSIYKKCISEDRVLIDTSGSVPGLTGYWDYVTNGNNLKKLWVSGNDIIVGADQTDSLNASHTASRHSYFNYSQNGGLTWEFMSGNPIVYDRNSAYLDFNYIYVSGLYTLASTGRYYPPSGTSTGYAATDLALGIGVFTVIQNTEAKDIFSYRLMPDKLACVFKSFTGDSLFYARYNNATHLFELPKVLLGANIGSGMRYFIATNDSADIYVMWWVPATFEYAMMGRRSTDGGLTFGSSQTIMTWDNYVNGDEVYPWPAGDIVYKNANFLGVAFSTYPAYVEYFIKGCKIVFWSPYLSGYKVIADWTNHPVLADLNFFENTGNSIQDNMTPVSHPTLAYSDDRSRLFCVYSVVQKDSTSYHFLYNDIWMSYSDNDGETWSLPYNLTNTPNADEIYPSISKTGNTQYTINITYSLSSCPGSASFGDTLTSPVCKVYQIYKKCDFVNGNCSGVILPVKPISGKVPSEYFISQNYPNPFNPETNLRFGLVKSCKIKLSVYDALGREIQRLIDRNLDAGIYEIKWNAGNYSSGVYFYSLQTEEFTQTKKMILLK